MQQVRKAETSGETESWHQEGKAETLKTKRLHQRGKSEISGQTKRLGENKSLHQGGKAETSRETESWHQGGKGET